MKQHETHGVNRTLNERSISQSSYMHTVYLCMYADMYMLRVVTVERHRVVQAVRHVSRNG